MTDKPTPPSTATPIEPKEPKLGWNSYAERLNGRFAMIGLLTLILLEFFTRQDFFTWLGLR